MEVVVSSKYLHIFVLMKTVIWGVEDQDKLFFLGLPINEWESQTSIQV